MARFNRAFDERLQRDVALKLLREGHIERSVKRFLNEARFARPRPAQQRRHRARRRRVAGTAGIWMELISGVTLQDLVTRQGPMGAREAALIGAELCRGLAAIHQAGFCIATSKPRM
jgi:serine/threonine protein kinase